MPLNNFGFVSKNLYRGAQPDDIAFKTFDDMGVDTILRLNEDSTPLLTEQLGFKGYVAYKPLPTFTVNFAETTKATDLLHDLIQAGKKVYVHCTHGRDRTGLVIGAYRLMYEGWKLDQVTAERKTYGVDWGIYIADFDIDNVLSEIAKTINER